MYRTRVRTRKLPRIIIGMLHAGCYHDGCTRNENDQNREATTSNRKKRPGCNFKRWTLTVSESITNDLLLPLRRLHVYVYRRVVSNGRSEIRCLWTGHLPMNRFNFVRTESSILQTHGEPSTNRFHRKSIIFKPNLLKWLLLKSPTRVVRQVYTILVTVVHRILKLKNNN